MTEAERPMMATADDWNDRYRGGDLPWDTQSPATELVAAVESGFVKPCRAMELGCGTGTNAVYLAEQDFQVTAVDISEIAIDRARQKAQSAGVRVDLFVADVGSLRPEEQFGFVFDRGCYHCVRRSNVAGYFATLAHLTRAGSAVLVLAGNANEPRMENGPPCVTEAEIRDEFGSLFEIQWLRPFRFESPDGSEGPLAWSIALVRRDA